MAHTVLESAAAILVVPAELLHHTLSMVAHVAVVSLMIVIPFSLIEVCRILSRPGHRTRLISRRNGGLLRYRMKKSRTSWIGSD